MHVLRCRLYFEQICGARVVDKSRGKDQYYRFELWLRTKEDGKKDKLKDRMMVCLADGNMSKSPPSFSFKAH